VKVTSITIGGVEWISGVLADGTEIEWQTGGNIANATIYVQDTPADVQTITEQSEVIIYSGSTKLYGGYISRIEYQSITPSPASTPLMRATLTCQDYSVLLDRVFISSEEYASQTDEAILDDLFSTYLSEISTADVNAVETITSLTLENVSLRRAVEMIVDRSGADWYVDANKHLQYWDSSSAGESTILLREDITTLGDYSATDFAGWATDGASYTAACLKLSEDSSSGLHYMQASAVSASASSDYIFEVEAKADERTWIVLTTTAGPKYAYFDLGNGAVGATEASTTASITEVNSGRYRCRIRFPSPDTSWAPVVRLAAGNGTSSYAGTDGYGAYIYSGVLRDGDGFLLESFQYAKDFTTPANKVTVVGELTDSSSSVTSTITVNADNGYARIPTSASWPPTGTAEAGTPYAGHRGGYWGSGEYTRNVCLLRFDTSAVPADAMVTTARLYLTCLRIVTDDATNCEGIGIEWYDASNWPIDASDYTNTESNSAWGYSKHSPTVDAVSTFDLKDADSNINRSGYTGLRIHTKFSGTPDGEWNVGYYASNAGDNRVPKLEITYTEKTGPNATVQDTSSQTSYGRTFERTIVDTAISTSGEATLRGNVELAQYAWAQESGSITFRADGLDIKDTLRIISTTYAINSTYAIRRLSARWITPEVTEYTAEFGDWRPDLIKMLRLMKTKVG